jgi:hypothetical protein
MTSPRLIKGGLVQVDVKSGRTLRTIALQYNPENISGSGDTKLVITGELRAGGQDRMQAVMEFVNTLSRDSVFSAGYQNIRLVTTRATATGDGAEFVIECR